MPLIPHARAARPGALVPMHSGTRADTSWKWRCLAWRR